MDWDWLTDYLDAAWAWLVDLLLWIPEKLYLLFTTAMASVIGAIPVPSWATGLSFDWVPASVAYFAAPFQIPLGVSVMTSAVLIRFLIRRLPVVG